MFFANGYTILFALIAAGGIGLLLAIAMGSTDLSRTKDGAVRAASELYWAVLPFLGMVFVRSFIKTSSGWYMLLILSAALAAGVWFMANALLRQRNGKGFAAPWAAGAGVMFVAGALGWFVRDVGWIAALIISLAAVVVVLVVPRLPALKTSGA